MLLSVLPPAKELDFKPPKSSQLKGMGNSPIQNDNHFVPLVLNHSERKEIRYIHSMAIDTNVLK